MQCFDLACFFLVLMLSSVVSPKLSISFLTLCYRVQASATTFMQHSKAVRLAPAKKAQEHSGFYKYVACLSMYLYIYLSINLSISYHLVSVSISISTECPCSLAAKFVCYKMPWVRLGWNNTPLLGCEKASQNAMAS